MLTRILQIWVLSVAIVGAGSAHAYVVNGDFSNGLFGWTTEDLLSDGSLVSPSASVEELNGVAKLSTQGFADPGVRVVTLAQAFTIDSAAEALGFDIGFDRAGTDGSGIVGLPDFLEVSWLDDWDFGFDRFLLGVDVNGFYDPNTFDALILPSVGNGLFRFDTGISDLAGRSGTLYFDLIDFDDGFFSMGMVDNVGIALASVPAPGTSLLLAMGLWIVLRRRR